MAKKILTFAVIALLITGIVLLCTIGSNPSLTVSKNIVSKTETIVDTMTVGLYNNEGLGKEQKFTVAQIKEKVADFEYYVEIGSIEKVDEVKSVSFGDATFEKDQVFALSIGNSNFIEDKAFYMNEGKLYIAAPIMAFESVNTTKIKINDSEFALDLEVTATDKTFTDVKFQAGSTNTATKNENAYDLVFNDAKTYLELYFEGAESTDVVLTKKVSKTTESVKSVSYGLTKLENTEGNPLGLYPIKYNAEGITAEMIENSDNTTTEYSAYVAGKGIFKATLNLDLTPSA